MGALGSLNAIREALSVVIVQFCPINCERREDINKNIERISNFMENAKVGFPNYDLIIFPESCIQGSGKNSDNVVIPMDSQEISRLKEKCRDLRVWGHFVFHEKHDDPNKNYWNTSIIVSSEGEIVLRYRKLNPFGPYEKSTPGDELFVVRGPKNSILGPMICYDRDFPEVSRELAMQGANILISGTNYPAPYGAKHKFLNQARAYENTAYFIQAGAVGADCESHYYVGESMVVNFDGNIICEAPEGIEYVIKADLYPQMVDSAREQYTNQNYLKALKHRGVIALPPNGDTTNPYKVYKDWN
jgi:predicted amidohydrolase